MVAAFVALLFFLLAAPARAEPDYPAFTGYVVDAAHVLSEADRAALTHKLADLQKSTNVQFAVATVPSLGGLEIEPYANALFRKWGIGQKGANNGLLLILAPNERKLRFEVGYGLEGTLTDAQSKLILRNDMVPRLKAGDPAGALKAGVDDAIAVLTGKDAALPKGTPQTAGDDTATTIVFMLLFFGIPVLFLILLFLAINRVARRRGWATGPNAAYIPTSNSSFSDSSSSGSFSSGDSSGSSDSFSGGGGGDSGGGGASDSY